MWESVKKSSKVCILQGLTIGSREWLAIGKSPKEVHVWNMQGSWRVTPAVALQNTSLRLARQLAHDLNSQLSQVARPSHQTTLFGKNWHFAFQTHTSINTPYTHVLYRASREIFERETLEKKKIDRFTIFILWFSKFLYSHPLQWYILERYIRQNIFLTIPISVRRLFSAWKAVRKGPIDIGWCYGL